MTNFPDDDVYANSERAAEYVRQFWTESAGSVLRAWIKVFDRNNDQRIHKTELYRGMLELNFTGDISRLFEVLDVDSSNELLFDEIDEDVADLWSNFRHFCVSKFSTSAELLHRCADLSRSEPLGPDEVAERSRVGRVTEIDKREFCTGFRKLGWNRAADLKGIFEALCVSHKTKLVNSTGLVWLDVEIQRARSKQMAKSKSKQWNALKSRMRKTPREIRESFDRFKAFLIKKHGTLIRAWRVSLSRDTMMISKPCFLKAAAELGFAKDAKDLWKALAADGSETASIGMLDPKHAESLAHFKTWVDDKFGGAKSAHQVMDVFDKKFVSEHEFRAALNRHGFTRTHTAKALFNHLDVNRNSKLELGDLTFLDRWKPLPFLLVPPNPAAMMEVKRMLLDKCSTFLKAWRFWLDVDGSGRCNWQSFHKACTKFGFTGDLAGAWRAFDADLSGYISMKELDETSAQALVDFRTWAHREFGSAKLLFKVFDVDASNCLSFQEFRAGCRQYGYPASSVRTLFSALDVYQKGSVSEKELEFLDDWDLLDEDAEDVEAQPRAKQAAAGVTEKEAGPDVVRRVSKSLLQTMRRHSQGMEKSQLMRQVMEGRSKPLPSHPNSSAGPGNQKQLWLPPNSARSPNSGLPQLRRKSEEYPRHSDAEDEKQPVKKCNPPVLHGNWLQEDGQSAAEPKEDKLAAEGQFVGAADNMLTARRTSLVSQLVEDVIGSPRRAGSKYFAHKEEVEGSECRWLTTRRPSVLPKFPALSWKS